MSEIKLNFKKTGWFADEDSARYESVVNENFKVRVSKNGMMNGFSFEFITIDDYSLDRLTGDFLSSFWNRATKKQSIDRVKEILNDRECFDQINLAAQSLTKRMKDFKNNYGKI